MRRVLMAAATFAVLAVYSSPLHAEEPVRGTPFYLDRETNTVEQRLGTAETEIATLKRKVAELEARAAVKSPAPKVTTIAEATGPFVIGPKGITVPLTPTARAPVGHTHTCPRCGTTWDHATNPGHNCPSCGTAQFVQDSSPRAVTVRTASTLVANNCGSYGCEANGHRGAGQCPCTNASPAAVQAAPQLTYSFQSAGAGGCSGAGCSAGSSRTGWYPGKLFGR